MKRALGALQQNAASTHYMQGAEPAVLLQAVCRLTKRMMQCIARRDSHPVRWIYTDNF